MSTGSNRYSASDFTWQGLVNGHYRFGEFTHTETDKIRIGTKIRLNSKDPVLVALFGGIWIPTQSVERRERDRHDSRGLRLRPVVQRTAG